MENMQHDWRRHRRDWRDRRNNGRVVFGFIVAGFGLLLLLKLFHLLPPLLYSFHFGWPLILIAIGLVIGIKNNFRKNAWWILILIGAVNLLPPLYIGDVPARHVLWPMLLILLGLAMVFRRRHDDGRYIPPQPVDTPLRDPLRAPLRADSPRLTTRDADTVNIDITFGGRKEIITSRNFRGGIVRATFAGAEINLAAAEAGMQPMVLEIHASFAGVELIVPSHWEIQNEINPTLGSVEDHRVIRTHDSGPEKRTLILRGSCTFGSIEVKSY